MEDILKELKEKDIPVSDAEIFLRLGDSPIFFVEYAFGLVPQPPKEMYRTMVGDLTKCSGQDWEEAKKMFRPEHFGKFEKGKHITWQQWLILLSLEKSINDSNCSRRISISSGHGIGKSATVAMIILWFLFVHHNAQVSCTAPSAHQMNDVLWKELKLWIEKMPKQMADMYIWTNTHISMKESPETWFARARTASKENTEALAGVHGDYVMAIADEASGVHEAIFNTMEGSLTGKHVFVILISNPTRPVGYFYRTHNDSRFRPMWQCLQFSGEDTPEPIIDNGYIERQTVMHGKDSEEYGIRVLGQFPVNDTPDDSGYTLMFKESWIERITDAEHFDKNPLYSGRRVMGVDVAGEGQNKTVWYIRDAFKAKRIASEENSNPRSVALKTLAYATQYGVMIEDVVVDAFGIGGEVIKYIAMYTKGKVDPQYINVGDQPEDPEEKELYMNKRAKMYHLLKLWFKQGGELADNDTRTVDQLLSIRFRRTVSGGKIQIMPKVEMKKKYHLDSPDDADALALTMLRETVVGMTVSQEIYQEKIVQQENEGWDDIMDRFEAL